MTKWRDGSYNEKDFQFKPKILKALKNEEFKDLNENGQKVALTYWEKDKVKCKKIFNENNICIELNKFTTKGALTNKEMYDTSGQLLEARRSNDKLQLCRSLSVSRTGYITHDTVLKYNQEGLLIEYIGHPIDAQNSFADLKDGSNGYSHKYFYTPDNFLGTDHLYLCGEHIMSYKYFYQFW